MELSKCSLVILCFIPLAFALPLRTPFLKDFLDATKIAPAPLDAKKIAPAAFGSSTLAKGFVDAHNAARAEVGVQPIKWNDTVAAYAQDYAYQIGDCNLQHSGGPYGENLAEASWELSAGEAVKMWVDEKKLYDYKANSCVGGMEQCYHYTQVVWRDSVNVGCARAQCKNGWSFVTCNYYPPGNYDGERPY